MHAIRIKKGYHLNVEGRPSLDCDALERPSHVAALPERIPFIKPRLLVDTGDRVKIGTPLFLDKRNPDFKFLSPGGGKVAEIKFGRRRVIEKIVIELDAEEADEDFETVSEKALQTIKRKELIGHLINGGVWPLIRELPIRDIAVPDHVPPMVFVSLDAKEPFQAEPEVYLKDNCEPFKFGLKVLKKLAADETVFVSTSGQNAYVLEKLNGLVTHVVEGVYPADDPGVLLYHLKKYPEQNRSWFVNGQDVLMIAHLLQNGKYPTQRTVVVAGGPAGRHQHFKTRLGVPLKHLEPDLKADDTRLIVGGIFRGYTGSADSYMGFYETSLTLVPEGRRREFMALFKPGFQKPSYSRAFLSRFNRSALTADCNRHGGERACIACMHCSDVCPVDILPQMTYKAILIGEVEEYLENGLLDCVECGLCSYVCPSKIELSGMFKRTKTAYAREQV